VDQTETVQNEPNTVQMAPESPTTDQGAEGVQTPTPATEATAAPISATATPTPTPAPMPDLNLDTLLSSLTPEQLAKIRGLAAESGLAVAPKSSGKLPDGSMTVSVYLGPDIVTQLEAWSEGSDHSLEEEAQMRIGEAITAYLYGDWGAAATAGAAPVTATTTTTGAGA